MRYVPALAGNGLNRMGFLDFFRGSSGERIARQLMKALREAGVTHRLEYEPQENQIGFYDASGSRVGSSFLGNLRRELEATAADSHAAIYRRSSAVWDNVARVMGSGMAREPGLPERYRVSSFPNAEQMVAMGTQVIS